MVFCALYYIIICNHIFHNLFQHIQIQLFTFIPPITDQNCMSGRDIRCLVRWLGLTNNFQFDIWQFSKYILPWAEYTTKVAEKSLSWFRDTTRKIIQSTRRAWLIRRTGKGVIKLQSGLVNKFFGHNRNSF